MSNMRIRNMFLLVTALAVMVLLACGSSEPEVPLAPAAPTTTLTGIEAVGLVQQWLSNQTAPYTSIRENNVWVTKELKCKAIPVEGEEWKYEYSPSSNTWLVQTVLWHENHIFKVHNPSSWTVYDKTWVVATNNKKC